MMDLGRESLTAPRWSRQQYESLFPAGDASSERFILLVEDDSVETESVTPPLILGFLVGHKVDLEWELENIVVAEKSRRRGAGSRLLSEFIAHARVNHGSGIFLEVRKSNESARTLYRRLGFEESGVRRAYYAAPPEDAILYHLSLC
jgi:ribosomal-protein-alanine acetyltransferase